MYQKGCLLVLISSVSTVNITKKVWAVGLCSLFHLCVRWNDLKNLILHGSFVTWHVVGWYGGKRFHTIEHSCQCGECAPWTADLLWSLQSFIVKVTMLCNIPSPIFFWAFQMACFSRFLHQNHIHIPLLTRKCHLPCPSCLPGFHYVIIIGELYKSSRLSFTVFSSLHILVWFVCI